METTQKQIAVRRISQGSEGYEPHWLELEGNVLKRLDAKLYVHKDVLNGGPEWTDNVSEAWSDSLDDDGVDIMYIQQKLNLFLTNG